MDHDPAYMRHVRVSRRFLAKLSYTTQCHDSAPFAITEIRYFFGVLGLLCVTAFSQHRVFHKCTYVQSLDMATRNEAGVVLGPVSYLDCIIFCIFLAPQLIWHAGFFGTVWCVFQALPFLSEYLRLDDPRGCPYIRVLTKLWFSNSPYHLFGTGISPRARNNLCLSRGRLRLRTLLFVVFDMLSVTCRPRSGGCSSPGRSHFLFFGSVCYAMAILSVQFIGKNIMR